MANPTTKALVKAINKAYWPWLEATSVLAELERSLKAPLKPGAELYAKERKLVAKAKKAVSKVKQALPALEKEFDKQMKLINENTTKAVRDQIWSANVAVTVLKDSYKRLMKRILEIEKEVKVDTVRRSR